MSSKIHEIIVKHLRTNFPGGGYPCNRKLGLFKQSSRIFRSENDAVSSRRLMTISAVLGSSSKRTLFLQNGAENENGRRKYRLIIM